MPATDHAEHETPEDELRARAALLLKAIAAESVPQGIADAARQLQQALAAAQGDRPKKDSDGEP